MLRNIGSVGNVAPANPAQIEVHSGRPLVIRLITALLQEAQQHGRRRFALHNVQRAGVQNAQADGGRVQHHIHRARRVALADLVVGDGIDLHGGVSTAIPGQHPDDVGLLIAQLRGLEIQLIGGLGIAVALFHGLAVQRDPDLIGVDHTGPQLSIGTGDHRQGESLGGHVQAGPVQIGDDGGWIVPHRRVGIVRKIRVIAHPVLNKPQEGLSIIERQHKEVICVEIQLCLVVLVILRSKQQSVPGVGLIFQPDTDMQIALTQGIGHKGQLAVGQFCLGELLGFQRRINAGGIILITAAAVVAAAAAVVPVISSGSSAMIAGILGTTLVVIRIGATLVLAGVLHGLIRGSCGVLFVLALCWVRRRLGLVRLVRVRRLLRRVLGRIGILHALAGRCRLSILFSGVLSAGTAGALQRFRLKLLRLTADGIVRPCPPGGNQGSTDPCNQHNDQQNTDGAI